MITFNNIGRYGRLGNQMFQYATLYSVAKELGCDFGIPHETNNQGFELPKLFNLSANDSSKTSQGRIFTEKRHDFDSDIFLIEDGTDIFGYFQTEKYFKKYSNQIKKEYQFPEKLLSYCNAYKKTLSGEIISLHVRRGDYLSCPENHPTCSIDYYKKAMNYFGKDSCFLVFSDDIQWSMKNLVGNNLRFFSHNHFYDLCMMSLCDAHIIANSSYSWWGAWLGNKERVVAPERWFGEALNHKNTKDVYCENWVIF